MFVSQTTQPWSPTDAGRPSIVGGAADRQGSERATIARLSAERIRQLSRSELVRVVRVSQIPVRSGRLDYLDRPTLERLAHLAKLTCCHRR